MPSFSIKEAAALLGVSYDTVRRWADGGRIALITDQPGRYAIDGAVLAAFAEELAAEQQAAGLPVIAESARNRFPGLVTRVVRGPVMAQVEVQAGPHRVVSLMSREAADALGLEPGALVVSAVKSTSVVVELTEER
ncbi:Molybdopterin-binding protein [Frankia sp. AiPs1]|uniref:TOBE domain-containing protein n=1 Tax=Frankia sp. AiPa1 TaxID=573492 RepID=UPI00202B22C3|nr:TOBE domain-containing protein [Frankia sp. AiPa1]MCL9760350.1 TOBE domain-containing protein [Frankia sp. AiPa1]